MKLLYATSVRFPSTRANRIQILSQARAFRRALGERFIFGIGEDCDPEHLGIPAVSMGTSLRSGPLAWKYLSFAKRENVTHIYCREEKLLFFLVLLNQLLFHLQLVFVYELHHLVYLSKWWHRYMLSRIPYTISITKGMEEAVKNTRYRGAVMVAPDAAETALFDIPLSKQEAREKVNLPKDARIVMYVGSIDEPWKGAGVFYEASKSFGTDTLFAIVGGKPHYVAEFKETHPPRENVLMLGHKDYFTEAPLFLKSADVLVLPNSAKEEISRVSTSPLKLFVYMAASRPIVASDLPSIREVLSKENSFLVAPDDAAALAHGITEALSHKEEAERRATRARKDVEAYTWEVRAKRILDFLHLP